MAAVEFDDVVDESLTLGGELDGFGRIRSVVFGRVGLAGLEVLTRLCGGDGALFDVAAGRRHDVD